MSAEVNLELEREVPVLEFKRLSGRVPRGAFSCGELEVDRYLWSAHRQHRSLKSRVTTAHLAGNSAVAAFYGLRMQIESDEDIEGHGGVFRTQDNYFSSVQICYLGTQRPLQNRGIGEVVMAHAVREFGEVAIRTGICAMTLVAINAERAAWYHKLGFRQYGEPCARPKMFFPAQSAIDLIEQNA